MPAAHSVDGYDGHIRLPKLHMASTFQVRCSGPRGTTALACDGIDRGPVSVNAVHAHGIN